jgi:hypothetical protein
VAAVVRESLLDRDRVGVTIVELDEFSRAKPDPKLFRVRSDYTVKTVFQSLRELEEKLSAAQN